MRIALVTRRFPPLIGGAEKVLSYLAPALADQGAEVVVLTSRLDESRAGESFREGRVRIVRLPTSSLRFVGTWLYMRNLRKWFDRNRVDIAYVSMLKHDAFVVVKAGKTRGFPVVLRPEGAGATGDIAWQTWGRGGKLIAEICKGADAVVAISTAVHQELIKAGYDPNRIEEIANGVPVPEIPWSPPGEESTAPNAVFVGRLAPEKGLHALIDAWPIVVRSFPEARLTLIGEGPERPDLQTRIDRLELRSNITMPGASGAIEPALRSSHAFVLPSREEGMSIALLEAMALGMPIVASDIPGNRKLIDSGLHGLLVRPDDPPSIAEAVVSTWRGPDLARRRGIDARERVIELYSIEAMARAHRDLFQSLLKEHTG